MRHFSIALFILIALVIICSCRDTEDRALMTKLREWDTMLNDDPYSIIDSLNRVVTNNIPNEQQAYYSLLLTIARDKTYFDFEDDKRISRAVRFYDNHNSENDNHVRALLYQSIVRMRMGTTDSTVYLPLRKAETIFNEINKQNPRTGYMLNYYIGNSYFDADSYDKADQYYMKALEYAKINNDPIYIFDAILVLFWNKMGLKEYDNAKTCLDSIKILPNVPSDKELLLLNAESYYYQKTENLNQAIESGKKQIALLEKEHIEADISKLYYSISRQYLTLNQIDSAKIYGEKAIEQINVINRKENFLYYINLAEIAADEGNYKGANEYQVQALDQYRKTVTERLSNQLNEAEKKYDLSISENKLLKSRQRSIFWALATVIVMLLLLIALYVNRRIRQSAKEKLMVLRHEAINRELEAKLMAEDAIKMEWLISIYAYLSERLTNLQDSFASLSQIYISSNPKVYEKMNLILHDTAADLKDMYNEIHPDDNTFSQYTGLSFEEASQFNSNEKMMLMLLASKASNKQIATFMNSTTESVRARKSQLKKKMIKIELDTNRFFEG